MPSLRRSVKRMAHVLGYEIARLPPVGETLHAQLAGLLPRMGIDLVLDVGAHWGEFGGRLRDAGYRGRIVSFEPAADAFNRLALRTEADEVWTPIRVALGRAPGTMTINVPEGSDFASFLTPNAMSLERFPQSRVIAREEVEVARLDDVYPELVARLPRRPRVFLKMDTQGWDLEVLAGAAVCVSDVVMLQSEVSARPIYEGMPDYLAALAEMRQLGFDVTGLYPVSRDAEFRVIEFDALLIRGPRTISRTS